jgi:exosortase A-associated hydrolase 1
MRRLIAFDCAGDTLAATLDAAPGRDGVLIVSGGNEIRAGAHRGMAMLAARLAADGIPVFRYDRRGVGDSEGVNRGYAGAADDLSAAAAAFRNAMPHLRRVTGLGNCDAATLLATHGRAAGIDAIVLTNPWTDQASDGLPPAAAIRATYAARLRDPRAWWRMLSGGVDLRKFVRGLRKISQDRPQHVPLVAGIADWASDATVILADGDATAIAYADAARGTATRTIRIPTASHSFARAADQRALEAALREVIRQLP